jgi:ornithine carbamoyltransferase
MAKHLLTLMDLGGDGITRVIARARELKALRGQPNHPRPLAGKSVAIIMEKASTRTRISFEVGVSELGGHPLVIAGRDIQIGRGEPLADTAKVLARYVHAVVYRTYAHARIEELASHSTIPVINALTDDFHPCQVLADLMTIVEHRADGLRGLKVGWIGDGNNMSHSWILAAATVGFDLVLACPDGYRPSDRVLAKAKQTGRGNVRVVTDTAEAARGAHVLTTDVWASMGQEDETAARQKAFAGYSVDASLMGQAAPNALFLHCLPAHRGEEVSAEVIDGPASRVWDEAENRLHVQKAVLELLLSAASLA